MSCWEGKSIWNYENKPDHHGSNSDNKYSAVRQEWMSVTILPSPKEIENRKSTANKITIIFILFSSVRNWKGDQLDFFVIFWNVYVMIIVNNSEENKVLRLNSWRIAWCSCLLLIDQN